MRIAASTAQHNRRSDNPSYNIVSNRGFVGNQEANITVVQTMIKVSPVGKTSRIVATNAVTSDPAGHPCEHHIPNQVEILRRMHHTLILRRCPVHCAICGMKTLVNCRDETGGRFHDGPQRESG